MPKLDDSQVERALKDGNFVSKTAELLRSNVWKHCRELLIHPLRSMKVVFYVKTASGCILARDKDKKWNK